MAAAPLSHSHRAAGEPRLLLGGPTLGAAPLSHSHRAAGESDLLLGGSTSHLRFYVAQGEAECINEKSGYRQSTEKVISLRRTDESIDQGSSQTHVRCSGDKRFHFFWIPVEGSHGGSSMG